MARSTLIAASPAAEPTSESKSLLEYFKARESDELVIGLVGPIGSGVTAAAKALKDELKLRYGYEAEILKVSDIIEKLAGLSSVPDEGTTRFDVLQDAGTELRRKHGPSYLMEYCIQSIGDDRKFEQTSAGLNPVRQRTAHIIDGLKNPAEIDLLRAVYREHFWAVAVLANEDRRRERLQLRGFGNSEEADRVLAKDADEVVGHGQKVRASTHRADYFIHNDTSKPDDLHGKVRRLLDRIFNTDIASQSLDEIGMSIAATAATRSACLSRQVGAAILSPEGDVLGVGWNDVPKFGGGLYGDHTPFPPSVPDVRCARMPGGECHNDTNKFKLYKQISASLVDAGLIAPSTSDSAILAALQKTDVKNIIEYSRSIHAEMEAILSAGRKGRSVVGSKLFTTTYPCHNCARHIVAAGISEVIYIEPYPKSLATSLHGDAISEGAKSSGKVFFRQYEGIAPRSASRVFNLSEDRKKDGVWTRTARKDATPVTRPALDSFVEREQLVIAKLEGRDEDGKAGTES